MKNTRLFSALLAPALIAFDPGAPRWKVDADGKLVADASGNPIYIDVGGAEKSLATDTVSRLNGEAKSHREAKEAAEAKLAKFEGIDADKARDAIEKIGKIDAKQLIDAGEVDRVKEEVRKGLQTDIDRQATENKALNDRLGNMIRTNAFSNSQFIKDKIAVPVDMLQAQFGNAFRVENDQLVAVGADGNKIMSPKRHGEYASFDEALDMLVSNYPHKDHILKGSGATGSGSGGAGGAAGGTRTVRRDEFEKMTPQQQAEVAKDMREGKATMPG